MRAAHEGISFFSTKPIQWLIGILVIAISAVLLATPYYLYAVLPGLVIVGMLLLGKHPQIAYYLIIFVIPFGAYRGLSETYQFLKIHWLLATWLVLLIFFQSVVKKHISAQLKSGLWGPLVLLLIISLISALYSDYPLTSYEYLFLLVISYLYFALNLSFIDRRGFSAVLPAVIIFSVSLSSLLGLIGTVLEIPLFIVVQSGAFTRSVGGSIDPNNLSLMIIFTLPLLAHWFFVSQRFSMKILAGFLFLLNIGGIVLTYSRGGAIILLLTLLLLTIEHIKKLKPRFLGLIVSFFMLFILGATVIIPATYWMRQKSVTNVQEDRAVSRRFSYLYVGLEAFKENPVLGSGPGTFRDLYARTPYAIQYSKGYSEQEMRRFAHNTYLEYLVGTGILGLAIFILIIVMAMRNFETARANFLSRGDTKTASLVTAYRISFLSLLLYFFIYSGVYHKYFPVCLALSQIALSLSLSRDSETDGIPAPHL